MDLGAFQGAPVELIGGQLVVADLQGAYHASAVSAGDYALRAVLPPGWMVRLQAPISLDEESEPEPDVAVVPGRPADYRAMHPAHPLLVIEVAESSLAFDRDQKGSLYARARPGDYWIVNLADRVLEVYRYPEPSQARNWSPSSLTASTVRKTALLDPRLCNTLRDDP